MPHCSVQSAMRFSVMRRIVVMYCFSVHAHCVMPTVEVTVMTTHACDRCDSGLPMDTMPSGVMLLFQCLSPMV